MKIEDQVCTLEQAKKLKELGIVQEGLCQYYFLKDMGQMTIFYTVQPVNENSCSAFTVAELGVMLGNSFQVDLSTFPPTRGKYYIYGTTNDFDYYDTEAQARAAKLIDVIERDFITVEEVNQRLNK